MGYGEETKPDSITATITSRNLIEVVIVWPCVMIGSPSEPSQQSSSTQRMPIRKWRLYMATDDLEVSWLPSRYELWLELMK